MCYFLKEKQELRKQKTTDASVRNRKKRQAISVKDTSTKNVTFQNQNCATEQQSEVSSNIYQQPYIQKAELEVVKLKPSSTKAMYNVSGDSNTHGKKGILRNTSNEYNSTGDVLCLKYVKIPTVETITEEEIEGLNI